MAKILNLVRLERKLKRLPVVATTEIRAGMEAAANEITAMMKSLVPVDQGDLQRSIGWTWGRPPKGRSVIAVAKASLGAGMTITIYAGSAEAYYARWVEFGTSKMGARPYFYVSWRASRKAAMRKVRAGVRKAARKVAAGT